MSDNTTRATASIDPIRPLLPNARESSRRACAAHAHCITALYGGRDIDSGDGLRVLYNPFVQDPDWNLGLFSGDESAGWGDGLDRVREELASRNRRPTVLLDSRRPEAVAEFPEEEWEEAFRFSGLVYPSSRASPIVRFPEDVEVLDVAPSEAPVEEIADVFEAAFGTTVTEGLDPGYRAGIAAGIERAAAAEGATSRPLAVATPRLRATVLRVEGRAAAIGFRVQVGAVAGLYNLGVAPAYRGRRLGGAITEHRVLRARDEGAEVVFLLTEDPRVERSQIKRGFLPGFELLGLTEKRRS